MRWLPAIAIVALAGLLLIAWRQHRLMVGGLPERHVCASQDEARRLAGPYAFPVLGTGSMVPFIPAADPYHDPYKTVVAYAVPAEGKGYLQIKKGDLCVYWANFAKGLVIHQAAQQDADGWIMSGLANRNSESFTRVTPDNFRAVIKAVYVFSL